MAKMREAPAAQGRAIEMPEVFTNVKDFLQEGSGIRDTTALLEKTLYTGAAAAVVTGAWPVAAIFGIAGAGASIAKYLMDRAGATSFRDRED